MYPTLKRLKQYNNNRTVKPFLSYKGLNSKSIMLTEKGKLITNNTEILNIMNNYFSKITKHLSIGNLSLTSFKKIIDAFKSHENIH